MGNEEELQNLLEEYGKWDGKFETQPKQNSDLNDELFTLGYLKNGTVYLKNGNNMSSLEISNKGKRFLKSGGFKRQSLIKLVTRVGSVIIFIVTVLTFFITLNDCTNKGKATLKKKSIEICQACTSGDCRCPHPKANDEDKF